MTSTFRLALRLLMIACLAVYGQFAAAGMMGNGTYLSVEICANGMAEIIHIDANGTPVDPAADCHDCLACAYFAAGQTAPMSKVAQIFARYTSAAYPTRYETPAFEKPKTRPLPRGPPMVQRSAFILPDAHAHIDGQKCCAGRPLFKDALA